MAPLKKTTGKNGYFSAKERAKNAQHLSFSREKRRFQPFIFTSSWKYLYCFYNFWATLKQDYILYIYSIISVCYPMVSHSQFKSMQHIGKIIHHKAQEASLFVIYLVNCDKLQGELTVDVEKITEKG